MIIRKNLPPGVLGLAVDNQRQFLLTKRNQPESPQVHEKWQVPGGGLEFGEQPEETLVRELNEELDIIPQILYPYPICKTAVWQHPQEHISISLMCFIITIGQQTPSIGDPESLEYRWVKKDELYRLECLPLTEVFIDEAIKILDRHDL